MDSKYSYDTVCLNDDPFAICSILSTIKRIIFWLDYLKIQNFMMIFGIFMLICEYSRMNLG